MSALIGAILPFLAIAGFTGGMIYRITTWRKRPSPPMTLYPAPESSGTRTLEVVKEVFLFKRLFYGDLTLWVLGGVFHLMLLVTLLDHWDRILAFMGLTGGTVFTIPYLSGGPTGIIILVCAAFLLIRRFALARVAQISSPVDFLILMLILGVIFTGDGLRYLSSYDLLQTREYFSGLLTFSFKDLPQNNWFIVHYLLGLTLILCIPFTKILHLGGIFFTQAAIHKH
ncbi:MAG: respiratory nitrate reductase subunit gamma [Planctomycetota bacterium]